MYIVKIYNNGIETEMHGAKAKLSKGSLVKSGPNVINSFSFTLNMANPCFNLLADYKTLVTIYNTNKNRYEFYGRVLNTAPEMDATGKIFKSGVAESYFGFLCDSKQKYVAERNWTVTELWQHIIDTHNSQVEDFKKFAIGEIEVTDDNDNLYLGIQRENTWVTIQNKLIEKLKGEIRFRVVDGVTYIDHLKQVGTVRATKIKLSHNMKAIRQENDPTAYISRLIPLGAKLLDEEGNETEERVDITSVNDGLDYIEDADALKAHGIRVEHMYFDDVSTPTILKNKGIEALRENNRVKIKYTITAHDLSLLGLDIDDFDACDYYPVVHPLLKIDDVARIIKKTIDVCDETKATIEMGDRFKTLSDIQHTQSSTIGELVNSVGKIESNYVTGNELVAEIRNTSSLISQTQENILASVEEIYFKKTTLEELTKTITAELELLSTGLNLRISEAENSIKSVDGDLQSKFNQIVKYFTFDIDGFTIGQVDNPNKIVIDNDEITIYAKGIPVQEFKADGTALIPILNVTKILDVVGLRISEDENNINCDYMG